MAVAMESGALSLALLEELYERTSSLIGHQIPEEILTIWSLTRWKALSLTALSISYAAAANRLKEAPGNHFGTYLTMKSSYYSQR